MKVSTIIQRTDEKRKERSSLITGRLETITKLTTTNENQFSVTWRFRMNSQTVPGKAYQVIIKSLPNNLVTAESWDKIKRGEFPLLVNCSCPDFMYRWETVLWQKNSARRLLSNGEWPNITNPDHKTCFCKHSLAALDLLKKHAQTHQFESIKPTIRKELPPIKADIADKIKMQLNAKQHKTTPVSNRYSDIAEKVRQQIEDKINKRKK